MFKKIIILVVLISTVSFGATLKNVTMPDDETVQGKKLILNGLGLREVNILGIYIKIYVAGLYVEKKVSSLDEIMSLKGPKRVKMQFLHKASANDSKKSWQEQINNNCPNKCEQYKDKVEAFKNLMVDGKEGDVFNYTFTAKGFEIEHNGKAVGSSDSPELAAILLKAWFGDTPITSDLKRGMLNIK